MQPDDEGRDVEESNVKITADSNGRVILQINNDSGNAIVKLNISVDAISDIIDELQKAMDVAKSVNIFVDPAESQRLKS